jgi:hypothetical protein
VAATEQLLEDADVADGRRCPSEVSVGDHQRRTPVQEDDGRPRTGPDGPRPEDLYLVLGVVGMCQEFVLDGRIRCRVSLGFWAAASK